MIRLNTTTRKLQIQLAGNITTNQLPVMVCYADQTTTTYLGATQLATTNNTTSVDICAAPGASTTRDVDLIDVYNRDTAIAVVSIIYNDNATTYTIYKASVAIGEHLIYTHAEGWRHIDANGAYKGIGTTGATGATGSTGAAGATGAAVVTVVTSGTTTTVPNNVISNIYIINKASGAAHAINLPATTNVGTVVIGKDGKGDANTNNITLTPNGANTIDGGSSVVITTSYGVAKVIWNGTQWNNI